MSGPKPTARQIRPAPANDGGDVQPVDPMGDDAWQDAPIEYTQATTDEAANHTDTEHYFGYGQDDCPGLAKAYLKRHSTPQKPMRHEIGSFWRYDPRCGLWCDVHDAEVCREIGEFTGSPVANKNSETRPLKLQNGSIRGAAEHASNILYSREAFLDNPPCGLAFTNGFLTIEINGKSPDRGAKSGPTRVKLMQNSPGNRARFGHNFEYKESATCPQALQMLHDTFGNAEPEERDARIELVQEVMGASMFGLGPIYEKCLLLWGEGNNGKSQLIDLVRACIPNDAQTSLAPSEWNGQTGRFRVMLLRTSLLNTSDDIKPNEFVDSLLFKQIITGEPVSAEAKYKDATSFRPRATHVFSTNPMQIVKDHSDGFFRRFHVLPMTRNMRLDFAKHEPKIGARIAREEQQGIITWAAQGAIRLCKQGGYTETPDSRALKEKWNVESDSVSLWLKSCCTIDAKRSTAANVAYQAYRRWAHDYGFNPVSVVVWSDRAKKYPKVQARRIATGILYNLEVTRG